MSRSGYCDEIDDHWRHIMWRGRVASAIRGQRGQRLLREMLAALDAMPEKRLFAHELVADEGYCALGVVGLTRGIDLAALDPENPKQVAKAFDIAEALAREIAFVNDEQDDDGYWVGNRCAQVPDGPGRRWRRVRAWAAAHIKSAESKA